MKRTLGVLPIRWRTLMFGRTAALTGALACLGHLLVPLPQCRADDSGTFSCDVELSPLAVDGRFPVVIQTLTGNVLAELRVDTKVSGKFTGLLVVNSQLLNVSGTAKHADGRVHLTFKANNGKGGDKITFSGDVADGAKTVTGTCVGKGSIVKGTFPCTVNLTTAAPLTATIECVLSPSIRAGKYTGKAHVLACGEDVPLKVAGRTAKGTASFSLSSAKVFKFTASGSSAPGDLLVTWTAKGFGGAGSGAGLMMFPVVEPDPLVYPTLPPDYETERPIATIIPVSGTAPRGRFTVSPGLPQGLSLDPTNGRISGTPIEARTGLDYRVTATNYAGTTFDTLSIATRIPRARSFAVEIRNKTDEDLRHFLNRAEFGIRYLSPGVTTLNRVREPNVDVNGIGLNAYIDQMLVFNTNGPAEAAAALELRNPGDPPGQQGKFPSPTQLARWWSSLMQNTDNPFQERLAFFWADRFAVSSDNLEVGEAHFMQEYVNIYRYGGNANLRDMLLKMARSGAMLKYLDGYLNIAGAVNENFGREFWELFTLGVDNGYTQEDIVQASRAFTGYKFVTDTSTGLVQPVFDSARHDAGAKVVFGRTIQVLGGDEYQAMVDLTLDHDALDPEGKVAKFITTKIFEHFAFENPHPALVKDMANTLRSQNYNLEPFLKALFKSEAFFSSTARASLVKNPVDYSIGFIHLTGLKVTPNSLQAQLQVLGQSPTEPPSVNGWPNGELWFSAQNMADRAKFLEAVISDKTRQAQVGINVANLLPPVGQRSAGQVVDALAVQFGLTLVATERQTCINYLNANYTFDGNNQAHLDDRVRGLLAILAQHPNYEIR